MTTEISVMYGSEKVNVASTKLLVSMLGATVSPGPAI